MRLQGIWVSAYDGPSTMQRLGILTRPYTPAAMAPERSRLPCGTMIDYGAPFETDPPDLKKLAEVFHPTGEWNFYEIECVGENLSVKINGGLITTARLEKPSGHIGIQAEKGLLEFRNLRIKVLDS